MVWWQLTTDIFKEITVIHQKKKKIEKFAYIKEKNLLRRKNGKNNFVILMFSSNNSPVS